MMWLGANAELEGDAKLQRHRKVEDMRRSDGCDAGIDDPMISRADVS